MARMQRAERILEYQLYVPEIRLPGSPSGNRHAAQSYGSRRDRIELRQKPCQRGLSATALADQRDDSAGFQRDADVFHRMYGAAAADRIPYVEMLGDIDGFQNCLRHEKSTPDGRRRDVRRPAIIPGDRIRTDRMPADTADGTGNRPAARADPEAYREFRSISTTVRAMVGTSRAIPWCTGAGARDIC